MLIVLDICLQIFFDFKLNYFRKLYFSKNIFRLFLTVKTLSVYKYFKLKQTKLFTSKLLTTYFCFLGVLFEITLNYLIKFVNAENAELLQLSTIKIDFY